MTGDVAVLRREERFVYYLITKDKYWQKPTYDTLTSSLKKMRLHCEANNVNDLCMPKIGCGLDGLKWEMVCEIIKDVFKDSKIDIHVYTL